MQPSALPPRPGLTFTARTARRLRQAEAHAAADRLVQARELYEQILDAEPDNTSALRNFGVLLDRSGDPEAAIAMMSRAAELQPDSAAIQHDRGLVLSKLGRHSEAAVAMRRAVTLAPDSADVHFGLGNMLTDAGLPEAASMAFRQAVRLDPAYVKAWSNLSAVLHTLGRTDEALDCARRATALAPDMTDPHAAEGELLLGLGDPVAAMSSFRLALRIDPQNTVARTNLGVSLLRMGRAEEALAVQRELLARDPDDWVAVSNLAYPLLSLGRFEEGLPLYEARLRDPAHSADAWPHPGRRWRGESPLNGHSILLNAEQGMGDTIQFVRYAPLLRARGARVHLRLSAALAELCRPLVDEVSTDADPVPETDLHCMLMSLPHAMGTTLGTIPANIPYLFPAAKRVQAWGARIGPRRAFRVGVAWSGNPDHQSDRHRSVPCGQFLRCVDVPGIETHAVQRDINPADMAAAELLPGYSGSIGDFSDSAALLSLMDLIITVDTSVAHLAGAIGRPVWILLAMGPDWRWMVGRDDSPWYPTARLFRQTRFGDWVDVLERVRAALAGLVATAPA